VARAGFSRDRKIYPDAGSAIGEWREPAVPIGSRSHRSESSTGYSLTGCSPAEPASASPVANTNRPSSFRCSILAYNLGNFMRTLAMPKGSEPWSLTNLREKLIKISAKVVSHGRYVTFQLAEVAVPQQMFAYILSLIARLRAPPAPA